MSSNSPEDELVLSASHSEIVYDELMRHTNPSRIHRYSEKKSSQYEKSY